MNAEEAAEILDTVAARQAAVVGDLAEMGYDEKALAESSGDLEVVEALRLGAEALRASDPKPG